MASPAARSHYLAGDALRSLVRDWRRTRRVSEDLALALLAIAGGVWDRYHPTADRDDFCQSAVLHLLQRPLRRAKLTGNLFSFFTTCTIRLGLRLRQQEYVARRRFKTYAEECREAGRPIPAREDCG